MKYKNVTVFGTEENKFKKALVETEFGTIEVTDLDKFNKIMNAFADQEKISLHELFNNESLVKKEVIETKKETEKSSESLIEFTDEEMDEIVFGSSKKTKKKKSKDKNTSKKKSGFVKKLIVSGIVVGILGTGAYHLDKHNNTFNGRVVKVHKDVIEFIIPSKDVNGNANNQNNGVTNQTVVVTKDKNFTIVDTGEKSTGEYDTNMTGVVDRQDKTSEVISQLDNNVVNMTKEEILTALNDNARIANSSIFEVSQFINGKPLTGKAYYYNFENNFSYGSYDYNAVKVFSDLRNDVLKAAYEEKDASKAKALIRDFYSLYAEVVTLGKKCTYNGYVLDFSEMSDMGKATVLELGVAMLEIYLPNYEYEVDGKTLSKEKILEDAVETLEGELIPTLIDKGYRK